MAARLVPCPYCAASFGLDYPVETHLLSGCWGNDGRTKPTAGMLARHGLEYAITPSGSTIVRRTAQPTAFEGPSAPATPAGRPSGRPRRKVA